MRLVRRRQAEERVTRSQADALLAEKGLRLDEIPNGFIVTRPAPDRSEHAERYDLRDLVSHGPTYQWATAEALDIAPF